MRNVNWERWARGSGIGFVVVFICAFLVFGDQPKLGDPVEDVVAFYDGDRGRVLTASFIFGVALLLFLWFVGAIANALREAGEGRLAATTIATAATYVGLQVALITVAAGLAHTVAGRGDASVTQALADLVWVGDVVAAVPLAGVTAAASVGLWRARLIPTWLGWAGLGVAALLLLRGTNWATDGFWAPDGEYIWIVIVAGLAWILVTSVLLVRRPLAEVAPRPTATPT
jgi:hypothetical protein